jgi:hypothetical protein
MATHESPLRSRARFKLHGHAGLLIIFLAEALLFSGNKVVGAWFTPIVWTGYILFVDALVYKLKGRSLLVTNRAEFLIVAVISIAGWWLFEFYNAPRFWNSDLELWWHYHNLEPNLFLRRVGYDWAFATISPAMFETAELLASTIFSEAKPARAVNASRQTLHLIIGIGCALAALPLIVISGWLAPLVWLGLTLMLDPLNALRGHPSIAGDIRRGDYRRLLALLASGGLCGVLWEFWNYWALTKWTYTVPYFGEVKIFEMPVLGYLGFPPFAVECWAMYVFVRGWGLGLVGWSDGDICPLSTPQPPSSAPPAPIENAS